MIIEAVDDSVILCVFLLFGFFLFLVMNFIKAHFSVRQLNPRIHNDAVNDVNRFRDSQSSVSEATTTDLDAVLRQRRPASPSAPPEPPRPSAPAPPSSSEITCPICLAEASFPIETNCGHLFCSACIINYWHHLTDNIYYSSMKCPMCRQNVSCLLPIFSRTEQQAAMSASPELAEVFTKVGNYNRRFGNGPRSFTDYFSDLPILLRHVFNELFTFDGYEIWNRIRFGFLFLVAIFYCVFPIDLIPEALFGIFGYIDDFLILFSIAIYITVLYRNVIATRNR